MMHSLHPLHPVTMMTFFNFGLVILTTMVSLYYLIWGRKLDRRMMFLNTLMGFWMLVIYGLFFTDHYWIDILSYQDVSAYLIKPLVFVAFLAWLANILRFGRRDD